MEKLRCKIEFGEQSVDGVAEIISHVYKYNDGSSANPGIQPDGSFKPGGPRPLLSESHVPPDVTFWFGCTQIPYEHDEAKNPPLGPVLLVFEDGRQRLAFVIRRVPNPVLSLVFFNGVDPL